MPDSSWFKSFRLAMAAFLFSWTVNSSSAETKPPMKSDCFPGSTSPMNPTDFNLKVRDFIRRRYHY